MKNFLLSLMTGWLCLCMNAYAQIVPGTMANLKLGDQNYVKNNMMPSRIVGSDESGIYMVKVKLKHEIRADHNFPVLEHYNDQMVLTKFRELKVSNTETIPHFEGIIELGNHLYCFYSTVDKSSKTKTLIAQEINKQTLSLKEKTIPIQSLNYTGIPAYQSPEFHYKLSPNHQTLLISSQKKGTKNLENGFMFSVFDKNLSETWSKEISSPFEKDHYSIENYHITDKGEVFMLTKTVKTTKNLDIFWEPNYSFQILHIDKDKEEPQLIQPKIGGKFISKMQIATKASGDLICTGFYLDLADSSQSGSYFLTLSKENNKIIHADFQVFKPDRHSKDIPEGVSKENNAKSIFSYSFKDLVFRNDGSSVLIGEQAIITSGNNPRNNIPGTKTSYNNISVTSIDPDGKIMWTEEIPKNQVSSAGYSFFSSFANIVLHDKIYFVFNDNPENLCEGPCKPVQFNPKSPKKEVLIALVELDWNGNIKKSALPFSRDLNILTKPGACEQISTHEMVILGQNNKSYQLAKLEFEKSFAYQ
ncbi:hypothetical protein [Echinicola salinicaeni]|uniref:hypothetical protein n=1 Tax=Echinicola salinicaeni TaxID=2762757 RepID=UPI00164456DF|nr:hypothetical protein [Echinicola salinicaeni]